jgi:predicted alpha/beta-hydrolase family hydrolase
VGLKKAPKRASGSRSHPAVSANAKPSKPAPAKARAGFLLSKADGTPGKGPAKPKPSSTAIKGGHVLLGHGAGGHKDHPHMLALAETLKAVGLVPHRFDFPYRAEGRNFPDKQPVLIEAFRKAAEAVVKKEKPRFLILAGHSMGSRAALALADEGYPCAGVMLFSYPLHAPGKPEKLRRDHMDTVPVPVLSVSGARDSFCDPARMEETLKLRPKGAAEWTHHWIEGADHGLTVPRKSGRTREDALDEAAGAIRAWMKRNGKGN